MSKIRYEVYIGPNEILPIISKTNKDRKTSSIQYFDTLEEAKSALRESALKKIEEKNEEINKLSAEITEISVVINNIVTICDI